MTTHLGITEQATEKVMPGRRSAAGPSAVFVQLAMASIAMALIGFHANVLAPFALGPGFTLYPWIAATGVVAAMWAVIGVRSGYHIPIPRSSINGALFLTGLFVWATLQDLNSTGFTSGVSASMQLLAGLVLFLIVASLAAQIPRLDSLNRLTFVLGAFVSAAVLLAALFGGGVDAFAGGSSMLPVLLALSLFAGLTTGNVLSPTKLAGLPLVAVALALTANPASLATIAVSLLLIALVRSKVGEGYYPSSLTSRACAGLFLTALLLVTVLLFNDAFHPMRGLISSAWLSLNTGTYAAQPFWGYSWAALIVPVALWASFLLYAGVRAFRLLNLDRCSALWSFGLLLAVLATLALSPSYQPMIWLTAAVVVGRYSRVKRNAEFRERLGPRSYTRTEIRHTLQK